MKKEEQKDFEMRMGNDIGEAIKKAVASARKKKRKLKVKNIYVG